MISLDEHKAIVLWASDCAKRVLKYYEKEYPKDDRPRKAIKAGRDWIRSKISVGEARTMALAAHAAARDANTESARAAARSAGHAAATVHVAGHARAAANYAVKAVAAANTEKEHEWQSKHIPKNLLPFTRK